MPADNAICATRNGYGLRLKTPASLEAAQASLSSGGSSRGGEGGGSAPSPRTGPPTNLVPELKPVKPVPREEMEAVVVPEHVDEDLADKSDYVKASVMARRRKLAEEQAARLAEVAAAESAAKQGEVAKEHAKVTHGPRLKDWAEEPGGARKNIRVLLSSLHTVLWEGAHFEPIPISKLLDPKRVRIHFLKAVAVVHPDKVSSLDEGAAFIATQVFHFLEDAYRTFQDKELASS